MSQKPKFTRNELFDLIDQAKKDWREIAHPLTGMKDNLTSSEVVALSYFMASLTILNRMLPEDRISDKIELTFDELDVESVFGV